MINLDAYKTPVEVQKLVAERAKAIRKRKKITQKELSVRSGVSLGSLKRFEQTGEVSFLALLKIAFALDFLEDFENVFTRKEYGSIQEILDEYDQQTGCFD